MSLGLDILKLAQIFLIIRLGSMVAGFIMPEGKDEGVKVDDLIQKRGNSEIMSIARSVISKCCRCSVVGLWWIVCAIGACIRVCYGALVKLWNGLNESEKVGEVKEEGFGAKVCTFESESKSVEEGNSKDEVEYGTEFVEEEVNVDVMKVEEWEESDSDEDESISEGEEENVDEVESDRLISEEENVDEVMAEAGSKSEEVNEDESESDTDSESEEVEEEEEEEDGTGSESESEGSEEEEEEEKICQKLHLDAAAVLNNVIKINQKTLLTCCAEIKRLQSPEEEITNEVKAEADSKSEEVNEVKMDAELKSEGVNKDEIVCTSESEDPDNSVSGSETEDESSSESEEDETESESESEDEWETGFFEKLELALARFLEENKQYQSEEAEFEAQRKLWDEEKQSLSSQIKQYRTSEAKWDEEKAALTKKIQKNQDYKTEKEELMNKYYKLVQEKDSIEVELRFQKKLAEEFQAGMHAFEEKYTEQREKNLELAGKLAAERFMVEKMSLETDDWEAKCQKLEEQRYDLMRELAAANYAYEYYRMPHRDS